ncbi:MAG: Ig-like domain-containing protein [Candidatus Competibacteraceae bacterium]|nr:Ig-like domain-containing protein [Candidatus Competibacteraceae bacterium]
MQRPIKIFRLIPLCLALGLSVLHSLHAATRPDFYAEFNPAIGQLPFPINLLFTGSTDGTLNIPVSDPDNAADPRLALNNLDGFSTVAPLTVQFSSALNADTVQAGDTVRVFEVALVNPFLNPTHPGPFAITGVRRELQADEDYRVSLLPQDPDQTTLNIHPLRPLTPKTGYLVTLTNGIQDRSGYAASPSPIYALTQLTTPLVDANGQSVISGLSDAEAQTLEPLRQLTNNQESAAARQGVARNRIVLSWTFMTQSIDDAFTALSENLQPLGMAVQSTGATTAAIGLGLPGFSDIYAGALAIPYYLDQDEPLSSAWRTAEGGAVTRYHPLPAATTTLQIPVLMTVPNASSGQRKPARGWPVVIFQHGITRSRTDLFAVADALSFAGFAAVAIDLPLHGVTDVNSPFYLPGMERTFDLDVVNNETGALGPDGVIDASGSYFINLQSMLTTRDNLREGVQDLRQLTATLPLIDLNGDQQPDFDARRFQFVGHSLGGMVGGTFLGIENAVSSGTLAMPGGGLPKLLDASAAFGPRIATGLANAGFIKGTPDYESYINSYQTVVDAGDPINYGARSARRHPIYLIEVVGSTDSLPDQVVPNAVADAPLSGTEPLARIMRLQSISRSTWNDRGLRAIVRFTEGDHSSIISPVASFAATAEMQGQMIDFLHSAGTELEVIYRPVVK